MKSRSVCFLVLSSLFASAVSADVELFFHFDRQSGTSIAVVKGNSGDVLVDFPWSGSLPRSYDVEGEDIDTPTLLLGHLRDLLDASADAEAPDAAQFIRALMGPHAATETSSMRSSLSTRIAFSSVATETWCGQSVSAGECLDPEIENVSPVCHGHPCKGTRIARP